MGPVTVECMLADASPRTTDTSDVRSMCAATSMDSVPVDSHASSSFRMKRFEASNRVRKISRLTSKLATAASQVYTEMHRYTLIYWLVYV